MKHKCEDCQHWRGIPGSDYGKCPEMGMLVVYDMETECGLFAEKEDVIQED